MSADAPARPAVLPAVRPARRVRRPGAGVLAPLRRLIGVDEELLARVPQERARYTWYGAIVLNTALLGGASMGLAFTTVRDELPLAVVISVAVIWFWVILALDGWLVSGTHGVLARGRLKTLLPRLALSLLVGLTIAEPLLFQIFDKEISRQTAAGNARDADAYRGMLASCNPPDGRDTTGRAECGGYQLKVPGSPASVRQQIRDNAARVTALQAQVQAIHKTLSAKQANERRECDDPAKWIYGRDGRHDVGDTCLRARAENDDYRTTSNITKYETELATLTEKSRTLAAKEETAGETYRPALDRAVAAKVRDHSRHLDDSGMLTRANALGAVAWSDWYAGFVAVVLHLLLLAVDALPVLVKLMSPSTAYDRLLTARLEATDRLHAADLRLHHACANATHEADLHEATRHATDRMSRLDHRLRLEQAERTAEFRAALEARAARIRR
ncbi:DUF4407 domain-containing protein [Streptomyces sp. AV19]|uniref:DUF4407 domain-containing protein n=1 Tax=Streptomyces sp. AV19 TaxID=2793068 RepID=UPI0018FE564A|nr:DUF4407 domain-containing protein [Streptomyces sp. AV19]MBH1935320.1 DUF4407 domain-containing protein [Streptomyces sp. AV19]MDG4531205.1 DUF4407 domain-containing protein [Streptomyces sp. AV19]